MLEKQMQGKGIFFFLLILFIFLIFPTNLFSQETFKVLRTENEELILDFFVLESEYIKGNETKYINVKVSDYDFKPLTEIKLPEEKGYNKIIYTLKSTFYLSEGLKDKDLALYLGPTRYPYYIYLNGKRIYKRGTYKEHYNSQIHEVNQVYLSNDLLSYGRKENHLALIMYSEKGWNMPMDKVSISSYVNVSQWAFWRNLVKLHVGTYGIMLVSFFVGLYFLFNFFNKIRNGSQWKYFFFAIMCFWNATTVIHMVFSNENIYALILEKYARISIIFSVVFLTLFIIEFIGILKQKRWSVLKKSLELGIFLIGLIFSFIIFLKNSIVEVNSVFSFITILFVVPVLGFNLVLLGISVFWKRNKYSIPLLISLLFVFVGSVFDMVFFVLKLIPFTWLSGYGYLILVISIFVVLALESETILKLKIEKKTKELKEVNQELEAFSSRVSHDLNNPLALIGDYISVIRTEWSDNLDEDFNEILNYMENSIAQMRKLIKSLLLLSRVKNWQIKAKELNLSKMIELICKNRQKFEPEREDVKFIIQEDVKILTDESLVNIVFTNIIGNSWKYTKGCKNTIIEFGAIKEKDKTIYFVRDNGVGFENKYAEKIFERFQRFHDDNKFEGSGIGLSTVKIIIERLQGDIWAKSEVGKGTTIFFTIGIKK